MRDARSANRLDSFVSAESGSLARTIGPRLPDARLVAPPCRSATARSDCVKLLPGTFSRIACNSLLIAAPRLGLAGTAFISLTVLSRRQYTQRSRAAG